MPLRCDYPLPPGGLERRHFSRMRPCAFVAHVEVDGEGAHKAGVLSDPVALFSGVNMDPFQAECEDSEAGEESTHFPSVVILAQVQRGG